MMDLWHLAGSFSAHNRQHLSEIASKRSVRWSPEPDSGCR